MLARSLVIRINLDAPTYVVGRGEGDDGLLSFGIVSKPEPLDSFIGETALVKVISEVYVFTALNNVGARFLL